jgi:hypothetical protein
MRHARRLGAAAVASSVSLLTTFGVAEGIRAIEDPATPSTAGNAKVAVRRTKAVKNGPSRLLVIRRATPTTGGSVSGGTIYVQAAGTATATSAPAPVAQAPAPPPVTQSS